MMTAPQPSSRALPMTLALVPGGPEPMTKGLERELPLTVVASVAMVHRGTGYQPVVCRYSGSLMLGRDAALESRAGGPCYELTSGPYVSGRPSLENCQVLPPSL